MSWLKGDPSFQYLMMHKEDMTRIIQISALREMGVLFPIIKDRLIIRGQPANMSQISFYNGILGGLSLDDDDA